MAVLGALVIGTAVVGACALMLHGVRLKANREKFIRSYMFPPGVFEKFAKARPGLEVKDQQLVARALRQFFLAYHKSGYRRVAMPSQVVDDLWHEFILFTREYRAFCDYAFGRFLHHTPAVKIGPGDVGQRRTAARVVVLLSRREHQPAQGDPTAVAVRARPQARHRRRVRVRPALPAGAVGSAGGGAGAGTQCADDFSDSSFDGSTDGLGCSSGGIPRRRRRRLLGRMRRRLIGNVVRAWLRALSPRPLGLCRSALACCSASARSCQRSVV